MLTSLLNLSNIILPPNFDSGIVNLFNYTFPANLPLMNIEIGGRILDSITGDHLDSDIETCTYTP
ncbi:MAG: hypothetical protein AB1422_08225 [bacterium]